MVTLIRYYNNLNDRALADYQVRPLISLNRLQIHNGIWYIQSGGKGYRTGSSYGSMSTSTGVN